MIKSVEAKENIWGKLYVENYFSVLKKKYKGNITLSWNTDSTLNPHFYMYNFQHDAY